MGLFVCWSQRITVLGALPFLFVLPISRASADRILPATARAVDTARSGSGHAGALEAGVLAELNRLRADPQAYARGLNDFRRYYRANVVKVPGTDTFYETEEGVAPLDEAVDYLRHQAACDDYVASGPLGLAAADHGMEQSVDGAIGHAGADGSTPGDRVARRGGGRYVAEVITYGSTSPADVVRQLIVDDGVRDRGHRLILFAQEFRYAGVFCGPHPVYREICVVDLARTPDAQPRRFDGQQLAMR